MFFWELTYFDGAYFCIGGSDFSSPLGGYFLRENSKDSSTFWDNLFAEGSSSYGLFFIYLNEHSDIAGYVF